MKLVDALLDYIFPRTCLKCGISLTEGVACEKCFTSLTRMQTLFCAVCRARLPNARKICHRGAQFIAGAPLDYHETLVKELIRNLKFKNMREASVPLGHTLSEYVTLLPRTIFHDAILVPIPLGPRRLRERGYNQAELIAAHLAKTTTLPLENSLLMRIRETKPQSELTHFENREANLTDAFHVRNSERARDRTIVLVDDVITSGATFRAAASALKSMGVRNVIALAAARA